jgi:putative transposase
VPALPASRVRAVAVQATCRPCWRTRMSRPAPSSPWPSGYGRYGYRRVTALLRADGWQVGKDRVQRIWRREGLKVPQKHRPRSRLWLNDGSGKRLRPLHRNHVWSVDFVQAQAHDGRTLRILTQIDEHSRACLALKVAAHRQPRRDRGAGRRHVPARHPRAHPLRQGPEMIAKALRKWVALSWLTDPVHRTRLSVGERIL